MSDVAPGASSRAKISRSEGRLGGGGLRIYKPGQGFYTRVGTAIGGGVLVVAGAAFVFSELGGYIDPKAPYALPVQYGAAVVFLAVMAGLLYWVVGLNRRINDFFIATDGEMKKVSWSSRRDVIRSTKVVIVLTVLLGTFLCITDVLFMLFFTAIKVLKAGPGLERIFGSGS